MSIAILPPLFYELTQKLNREFLGENSLIETIKYLESQGYTVKSLNQN